MAKTVEIDFQKALAHIQDGRIAVQNNDSEENLSYFEEESKEALENVPQEIPYIKDLITKLENWDFDGAFEELANLASAVQYYSEDEYQFAYESSALDRVLSQFFQEKSDAL